LQNQILELAAAVEDGAPELFAAHAAWSAEAFTARAFSPDAPVTALKCLSAVLEDNLPPPAWALLPTYFQRAQDECARRSTAATSELTGQDADSRLAREYVSLLAAGDEPGAITLVLSAVDEKRLSASGAIDAVLAPALREIGRLWHRGELGIAEEHFATVVTRKVLARLLLHAPTAVANGRTVIVSSVEGDAHDIGVNFVSAFFELDGWRSICLGADTPVEELVRLSLLFDADLVALGATLGTQRQAIARTIAALKTARPGQRVLVGGAAFTGGDDLWRRIGADAHASSARDAVKLGRALAGLR
jgi:methanogenic corrinoid protein MtbC1